MDKVKDVLKSPVTHAIMWGLAILAIIIFTIVLATKKEGMCSSYYGDRRTYESNPVRGITGGSSLAQSSQRSDIGSTTGSLFYGTYGQGATVYGPQGEGMTGGPEPPAFFDPVADTSQEGAPAMEYSPAYAAVGVSAPSATPTMPQNTAVTPPQLAAAVAPIAGAGPAEGFLDSPYPYYRPDYKGPRYNFPAAGWTETDAHLVGKMQGF